MSRARSRSGVSLLELLLVVWVLIVLTAIAVPAGLLALDQARTTAAARYLAGRVWMARMEAVRRTAYVGIRFEDRAAGYPYALYADGNGNGIRSRDIASGVDRPIGSIERLQDHFSSVRFGVAENVTGVNPGDPPPSDDDPIQLGRSDILSFGPNGTATSGSLYVLGRRQHQAVVRVLGATGRTRVLRYSFSMRTWMVP